MRLASPLQYILGLVYLLIVFILTYIEGEYPEIACLMLLGDGCRVMDGTSVSGVDSPFLAVSLLVYLIRNFHYFEIAFLSLIVQKIVVKDMNNA